MEDYIVAKIKEKYGNAKVAVTLLSHGHFEVSVVNPDFAGMTILKQQREIMNIFKNDFDSEKIHALSLQTSIN